MKPVKISSTSLPPRILLRRGGILFAVALGTIAAVDHWLPYALLSHYNRPVNLSLRPVAEQMRITAGDGTATEGWLIPPPENVRTQLQHQDADSDAAATDAQSHTTLVLLHGLGANRQDYLEFGLQLQQVAAQAELPLELALMDMRSHGSSGGDYFTYGYHEAQDVTALIDVLETQQISSNPESANPTTAISQSQSPKRISRNYAILGISAGGAVATAAAAQDDRLTALITIGTFADLPETAAAQTQMLPALWRDRIFHKAEAIAQFNIVKASPAHSMAKVKVPVLIAHGSDDGYIPFINAEQLYAAANEPKRLYPIAGADHADMVSRRGDALRQEIVEFLKAALVQP